MGKFHQLLKSSDESCESLSGDSYFSIMLANKADYEGDDDENEVKINYKDKEQCKVLVCTS